MAFTSLPSMRIIYFSNQPPEVVNAVIEGLEALGQQVLLLVTTPGPRARPSTEYENRCQCATGPGYSGHQPYEPVGGHVENSGT